MIGRYWRGFRRWIHNRFGTHDGVFIAKYGRVCPKCSLPVRWDGTAYVLKTPFLRNPPVGRS